MRDGPSDLTNTDDLRRLMRRSAVAYLLGSSAYIFEMPGAGQPDPQGYVLRSATARLSEIAGTDLPPVAAEATLALGHLGHRAAKATLEASLDRAAPVDLPRVLAALRGLADAESAVHVGRAADRMDEAGRLLAVAVLGEIGGPTAVTWLVRRAQDPRSAVRAAAADALGGADDDRAAATLARLADDPDAAVRLAARRNLGRRGEHW
jgi:HEAT repeat protein